LNFRRATQLEEICSVDTMKRIILPIIIVLFYLHTNKSIDFLQKCYGKYGCFSVKYPWYSSHRVVNLFPKSAKEIQPNFFLYTRQNRRKRQELFEDDPNSLHNSFFDPSR
jgi:hypothetical protein